MASTFHSLFTALNGRNTITPELWWMSPRGAALGYCTELATGCPHVKSRDGGVAMGALAFRLRLVEASETWVVVCDTPFGESVRRIPAEYTAADLRVALAEINMALVRAASQRVTRRTGADRAPRALGDRLSAAVLGGEVRALFDRCRLKAREQGSTLQVMIDTEGPNVSRIPWELMTDPAAPDDYLALRFPVVRSPHLLDPPPPRVVEPPLRVLCVAAQPQDLLALDVASERNQVSAALHRMSSDLVEVEWLGSDHWRDLSAAVRFRPWHVLHFIGHGGFDEDRGTGYVELSDDEGKAMQVSGTDLGRMIAANPELRLVLLNACETAATGAAGVFSSPDRRTNKPHEQAGWRLLVAHGLTSAMARFARTHGSWRRPGIEVEDLLVTMADEIWEGHRIKELEQVTLERITALSGGPACAHSWTWTRDLAALANGAAARLWPTSPATLPTLNRSPRHWSIPSTRWRLRGPIWPGSGEFGERGSTPTGRPQHSPGPDESRTKDWRAEVFVPNRPTRRRGYPLMSAASSSAGRGTR